MTTPTARYICLGRDGGVLARDSDGIARFVIGQSRATVLERLPRGHHQVRLRTLKGKYLTVDHHDPNVRVRFLRKTEVAFRHQSDGVLARGRAGFEIFTEVVVDGAVCLMLPDVDGVEHFLYTFPQEPGGSGGWPDVYYGSDAANESARFTYEVPSDALLPDGHNEQLPDNSGSPVKKPDIVGGVADAVTDVSGTGESVPDEPPGVGTLDEARRSGAATRRTRADPIG